MNPKVQFVLPHSCRPRYTGFYSDDRSRQGSGCLASLGNKFGRSVVVRFAVEKYSAGRKLFLQQASAFIDSECGEFIPPGICEALVRSFPMSHPRIVQNDRSKEQGIQEVQLKRTDPATDLAERAIRRWQISGSKALPFQAEMVSWSQRQVDLPERVPQQRWKAMGLFMVSTSLARHPYEASMEPTRATFTESRTLSILQAPNVNPILLDLFLIYFTAVGVAMTELVENWMRRAGERCEQIGLRALGHALRLHSNQSLSACGGRRHRPRGCTQGGIPRGVYPGS
jgi:hypothetical protein